MTETTINQRLKFLMDALGMKAGAFSRALGISETNIRNYTDRTSKPGFEVLEKIATTFKQINLAWLITGEGEPIPTATPVAQLAPGNSEKNSGNTKHSTGDSLAACQRDLEAIRRDAASYQREIELLKEQIEDKKEIIALLHASTKHPR